MIKEVIAHVSISDIPGIGPTKAKKILNAISSYNSEHIYETILQVIPSAKIDIQLWESISSRAEDKAQRILETGIHIIPYLSESYPSQLKELNNPPINLYIDGNLDSIQGDKNIAIIGTRNPDEYTKENASDLCEYIAQKASCVVSGLAIGCDSIAHQACIKTKNPTAAILPCGIDQIYPKKNIELANKIKATGGCLISEYEPGIKPQKSLFVARDRIQAGLSHGIVLLQSTEDGGSMHAIRTMQSLQRPFAAIAEPLPQSKSHQWSGNRKLIEDKRGTPVDLCGETNSTKKIIDSFLNKASASKAVKPYEQPSLF